jgi:lipoate-protein ligase A
MAPISQRLLIDPPCSGTWNMAVDEVLLEWAAEQGGCAWRFYQWSEPTLSLGYFQKYEARDKNAEKNCAPSSAIVRRLTGGGAILHDRELTYSLVVPAGHALAARRETLYDAVHRSLIETLAGFGVAALLCTPDPTGASHSEPFLCFQRRASGDVLVGQTKIAGSAQRRRRGAVLQHGSILLRRSPAAPELPGLDDVSGVAVSADQLAEAWLPRLADHLNIAWQPDQLTEPERRRTAALAEGRYATFAWTGTTRG